MAHFKLFAGKVGGVGVFNTAIIRICGKRLEGGAGYYINRNDHMLQVYVRTSVDVAVPVDETGAMNADI